MPPACLEVSTCAYHRSYISDAPQPARNWHHPAQQSSIDGTTSTCDYTSSHLGSKAKEDRCFLAESSSPKEKGKAAKGKQDAEKPASNLTRLLESTSHGGPADYVVAPQGLFPAPLSETNSKAGMKAF